MRVRAVVTHISLTGWTALFVDDGTAGIWVDTGEDVAAAIVPRPAAFRNASARESWFGCTKYPLRQFNVIIRGCLGCASSFGGSQEFRTFSDAHTAEPP